MQAKSIKMEIWLASQPRS